MVVEKGHQIVEKWERAADDGLSIPLPLPASSGWPSGRIRWGGHSIHLMQDLQDADVASHSGSRSDGLKNGAERSAARGPSLGPANPLFFYLHLQKLAFTSCWFGRGSRLDWFV